MLKPLQTEEFDFRVRPSQLSQDLRDGVRLCRLVDAMEVSERP